MGLFGDIGDLVSTSTDLLGGIPGGGGGGGGSFMDSLFSPTNVLLAGMGGLNYLGSQQQGQREEKMNDRQFQLLQDRFAFDKTQHADTLKERALERKFGAGRLAADVASSQIGAAAANSRAAQQAALQKAQMIQGAYQNLVGALLSGGGLSSNALGSLTRAAQAPLLG